ncbi:MAG: phage tail tube protein [Myxococcota bacterium]
MSSAFLGKGTQFQVESSPGSGTYVTIAEVLSIDGPDIQGSEVEVTNMDSTGRNREYIAGLTDPGGVDLRMNFVPGNAQQEQILDDVQANPSTTRSYRIRFAQLTPVRRLDFSGFILNAPYSIPVDSQVTQSVRVRVSGVVTRVQE